MELPFVGLPGAKVSPQIAEIRGIRVGEDSISPNRHPLKA
jgi:glutamate synthase domain-containing protein 2